MGLFIVGILIGLVIRFLIGCIFIPFEENTVRKQNINWKPLGIKYKCWKCRDTGIDLDVDGPRKCKCIS